MKFVLKSQVHLLYELVNISDAVLRKKDMTFHRSQDKAFLEKKGYQKEHKQLKDFHHIMEKEVKKNLEVYPLMKKLFSLGGEERGGLLHVLMGYGKVDRVEALTMEHFLRILYILFSSHELSELEEHQVERTLLEAEKKGRNPEFYLNKILGSPLEEEDKIILLEVFQHIQDSYESFLGYFGYLQDAYLKNYLPLLPLLEEKVEAAKKNQGSPYFEALKDNISSMGDMAEGRGELFFSLLFPSSLAAGYSVYGDQTIRLYAGVLFLEMEELRLGKEQKEKDLLDTFKALGDENRLKILELVSHKAYYMKELADELKISPSTLSHHVDHLLQVGLLRFYTKGRRVYLELGREKISTLSKSLIQLAERGNRDLQ